MVAALCMVTVSKAQMKPEAGTMGLGFHVNGLANVAFGNWGTTGLSGAVIDDPLGIFAPGTTVDQLVPQNVLFGRYYLSSNMALRVSLGINSLSSKSHSVDSVFIPEAGINTTDDNTSAFSFGIGAGIENHFATSASRLDPYVGAEFSIGMLGGINNEMTSDNVYPTASNNQTVVTTTDWKGGMSYMINLLGGFNYFFSDNVAIGAEVGWGFGGLSMGGTYTQVTDVTVSGVTTTTQTTGEAKVSASGFRVNSTGGVNFSIFW